MATKNLHVGPHFEPEEEALEDMEDLQPPKQPKDQKKKGRPRPQSERPPSRREREDEDEEWQPSQKQTKQSRPPKPAKPQILEPPPAITSRQANWRNANWPAWGHLIAAAIALAVWFAGTSVQVETSEAWILSALEKTSMNVTISEHFSVFGQIGQFWNGGLDHYQVVAYMFSWGTQAALILFSLGVDLPAHTKGHKYRSNLFIWVCILLIGINSLGDWFYSAEFGTWGQLGFVLALFVSTFCFGWLAIHQVHRAIRCFRGLP